MGAPSAQPVRSGAGFDNSIVKRRACDECRSRKLACTKESDGCGRCKRDGMVCHYSPQKQMGRPKKRRSTEKDLETSSTAAAAPTHAPVAVQQETVVAVPDPVMGIDPVSLMDPSLSAADINFLDLLESEFAPTTCQVLPQNSKGRPLDGEIWNFNINFDPYCPPPDSTGIASSQYPLRPDLSTPSLPSQGAPTPELAPLRPDSCSCLANLYLALESLACLPTEVGPAMHVARSASKAAHDAVQCQICSPPLSETTKIPIAAFQNTMVLGALLPSIADAYQRILDMVDAEAARGARENRQLRFALPELGGVWGMLRMCSRVAGWAARYDDEWMEPAMWRLLVRALLKTDVYGTGSDPRSPGGGCLPAPQLGLKDIIAQMDERSRARHAEIDALVDAGFPAPTGPSFVTMRHSRAQSAEEPHCRRIIKMAGEAMDRLVIP